ncbi:hypothetical protein HMPREF1868_00995 [Olsenella sp. DNF00959]|nr:hypothetical protein HMPREF1868_00995 [Olsenella sp. DNF00959]
MPFSNQKKFLLSKCITRAVYGDAGVVDAPLLSGTIDPRTPRACPSHARGACHRPQRRTMCRFGATAMDMRRYVADGRIR